MGKSALGRGKGHATGTELGRETTESQVPRDPGATHTKTTGTAAEKTLKEAVFIWWGLLLHYF